LKFCIGNYFNFYLINCIIFYFDTESGKVIEDVKWTKSEARSSKFIKKNDLKAVLKSRKLFAVYFIIVLLIIVLPVNTNGKLDNITILRFRGDYILHALLYVPWMVFNLAMKLNRWLWYFYGFLFAAGTEIIQYLLPYRVFNINDLVANLIGIVMGFVVLSIIEKTAD